jgi:hypothetical protein
VGLVGACGCSRFLIARWLKAEPSVDGVVKVRPLSYVHVPPFRRVSAAGFPRSGGEEACRWRAKLRVRWMESVKWSA